MTSAQRAERKKELEKEAKEYEEEMMEGKKRNQRKSRATYSQFKQKAKEERIRMWKWACRKVIKRSYVQKIYRTTEAINAIIAGETQNKADNPDTSSVGSSLTGASTISKAAQKTIQGHEDVKTAHHERLSKLHFDDKEWKEAIHHLKETIKRIPKKVSNIEMLSESYISLFHETKDFTNLEHARTALGTYLSRMKTTIFTLPLFPKGIFRLGRVYEIYGSFEGALEVYGMILELFPKYNKYKLVLYRCAVVMLHLANLSNADVGELTRKARELMEYCLESSVTDQMDMSHLSREDVCMVYARILAKQDEHYSGETNKSMLSSTMSEIFFLRKERKLTGRTASTHLIYFKSPLTWINLASEYSVKSEPTLAVNMYDEAITLMKKSGKKKPLEVRQRHNTSSGNKELE
jgi:tetratricopeptide (TPR) repeat protein